MYAPRSTRSSVGPYCTKRTESGRSVRLATACSIVMWYSSRMKRRVISSTPRPSPSSMRVAKAPGPVALQASAESRGTLWPSTSTRWMARTGTVKLSHLPVFGSTQR